MPSNKNKATSNVFTSSYLFSAANHRVYHKSPDHLRRLSLSRSSCSDSSVAIVLILAVSISLQKRSNNNGDFLCFPTQALNIWIFLSWPQYFQVYKKLYESVQTFRFYISNPLRISRMVLRVLDVSVLELMLPY